MNTITCVDYGQKAQSPNRKVFEKKGISNGLQEILSFRKQDNEWMLVSFAN
jgi:hypothetical protein